jgi:CubicO group peptidase (beta-lactamase class C family)
VKERLDAGWGKSLACHDLLEVKDPGRPVVILSGEHWVSLSALKRAVLLGAAAISFGASGATAAQVQTAPSGTPASEAEIAASPAAKRFKEAIHAIGQSEAAVRAFAAANVVPQPPSAAKGGITAPPTPLFTLLNARYRSHGYTLLGFTRVTPTEATARLRNNLTQDVSGLTLSVESEAPHRVVFVAPAPVPPEQPKPAVADDRGRVAEVSAFVNRLVEADAFSGVVLIARDGKPIFERAYGYADREKRIPNGMNTRFRLASLNKIFTALAIARLVEQGKLSYEDPLSKFMPDFPDAESAKKIRIKHLLSHTSGLGGYFNPAFFGNIEKMLDVQSVMSIAGREPPAFEPGTGWRYSNTGFHLLGRIIEIVSGQDYFDYMDQAMFKPLGLKKTGFPHYDRAGPEIALPYEVRLGEGDRFEHAVPETRVRRGGPAGDGATTAGDLLRLANLLWAGKVVEPAALRLLSTPKPELNSPQYGYGMALFGRMGKRDIFGHGGDFAGTCTEFGMVRDMPSRYTVVILANSPMATCHTVSRKIYNSFSPAPDAK